MARRAGPGARRAARRRRPQRLAALRAPSSRAGPRRRRRRADRVARAAASCRHAGVGLARRDPPGPAVDHGCARRALRRPDAESRSLECDHVRQGLLSRTGSHRACAQLGLGQAAHAPLRARLGEPATARYDGLWSRRRARGRGHPGRAGRTGRRALGRRRACATQRADARRSAHAAHRAAPALRRTATSPPNDGVRHGVRHGLPA